MSVERDGETSRRTPALTDTLKIPIRSSIDPDGGVVRLTTATGRAGGRKLASVSGSRFTVRQRSGRRAVTCLSLVGRLPDCRRSSAGRTTAGPAARLASRKLRVAVHHRRPRDTVQVHGCYSIDGSLGTSWITEDRCDGTLTTVLTGIVRARDLGQENTVMVSPGRAYLAKP